MALTARQKLDALNLVMAKRVKTKFDVGLFCFKEQLDFIKDPSRFKTAVCSRRSGKTVACAAHLIHAALSNPNRVCLYITITRLNAKRIIWAELTEINRRYNLGGKVNETELSISFDNKSIIYLSGAKDKGEVEKFRGMPIALCYIDEVQSMRGHIETLVDDVISKALFDYNGVLCLIGTPGPVPSGYFHSCATSKNWSHHAWTMFENPHLEKKSGKTVQALVDEELSRKGVTIDNPTIQRECYGRWVVDADALVFKYSAAKNHYDALPVRPGQWDYVIGVDLGYDDSDAVAVLGWHPNLKEAYLIEEHIKAKQGITELATLIESLITRFNPLSVVMDTGGLGKKISEEMQRRYSLPIRAAEKSRKFEYIELLNDAMRTKRFFAKKESTFAQDCLLVEWDKESANPKISDNFHSDATDAVLYAFRESLHWLSEPLIEKPRLGSIELLAQQEREHLEFLEEGLRKQKEEMDIWGDIGLE